VEIPGLVAGKLSHTTSGITLVFGGLSSHKGIVDCREPTGMLFILVAKAAQNIRLAVHGLTLGYYSGAITLLRTSLEALQYGTLFIREPLALKRWIILQLRIDQCEKTIPPDLQSQRRRFDGAVIQAWQKGGKDDSVFGSLEGFGEVIRLLVRAEGDDHTHITWRGLAQEFGLELEDFVPTELDRLVATEKNRDDTLEFYESLTRLEAQSSVSKQPPPPSNNDTSIFEFTGRYDPHQCSAYSTFAAYMTHRALLLVKSELDISDGLAQQYANWSNSIPMGDYS